MAQTNQSNPEPNDAAVSSSTPMTIERRANPVFIETRAHTRFAEFAEACATYRYIGVCHGRPGVGKTRSAREYAAYPNMAGYGVADPLTEPLATQIVNCRAFFYTVPVANTPKIINAGMDLNILKLGHARLTLDGVVDRVEAISVAPQACPLVIVDEADRLSLKSLEYLRDLYDRHGFGLILLGMPGLEKRLARYAQFYSRIGFVHEFKPLTDTEMRFVLAKHVEAFGLHFDPERLEAVEALAAVIRITRGNFRLMERLVAQMRRIMALNQVEAVSPEVAEAARDCLVIGPGD